MLTRTWSAYRHTCELPASWPGSGAIEFADLSIKYSRGGGLVLDGLKASITACEKIGVVGRTGGYMYARTHVALQEGPVGWVDRYGRTDGRTGRMLGLVRKRTDGVIDGRTGGWKSHFHIFLDHAMLRRLIQGVYGPMLLMLVGFVCGSQIVSAGHGQVRLPCAVSAYSAHMCLACQSVSNAYKLFAQLVRT